MADRPRLLLIAKKHLRQVLSLKLPLNSSDASTVLLAVSNSLSSSSRFLPEPAVFSLRPIWHRVFCEPGRVGHPNPFTISDCQFPIERRPHDFAVLQIGNRKSEIGNYKEPSNLRLNSWRPRANLDLTVPTLMPKVVAISSYENPSISRRITVSR
jgi:hypothetical protein